MGRESGFIAAQATLSLGCVNFVLVPEAPFRLEGAGGLLSELEKRLERRGHAVIVAAEGAGQHLMGVETRGTDASGNLCCMTWEPFCRSSSKNILRRGEFLSI